MQELVYQQHSTQVEHLQQQLLLVRCMPATVLLVVPNCLQESQAVAADGWHPSIAETEKEGQESQQGGHRGAG
jgi:hypothetical protein